MVHDRAAELFREVVANNTESHFEALEKRRALSGLERIPFLSAPVFFEAREQSRIVTVLDKITSAIERVGQLYFSGRTLPGNRTFDHHIPLSDHVLTLCRLDSTRSLRLCVSRYDVVADPHSGACQVLEVNPGDPSAIGYHDVMLDGLLESPASKAIRRRFQVESTHLLPLHRQALLDALPESSRLSSLPTVAFAVAKESTVRDDHLVMAQAAREAGFPAHVGDPSEFTYDGQRLRLSGAPIDVVWRDIIDEFTLGGYWEGTEAFRAAYRHGGFALRNLFSVSFAECKGVLDILSDEMNDGLFDSEENDALRAHIPWTRLLMEGRTVYEGREADLIDLVRDGREQFVIKPNIGSCGFNVVVGCECSQDVWDARIRQAAKAPGSDIVQRYCPLPTALFPTPSGDCEELAFVSSFWQFGSDSGRRSSGSFIRASKKRVVNIHQGGGISTIFWVS